MTRSEGASDGGSNGHLAFHLWGVDAAKNRFIIKFYDLPPNLTTQSG